MKVKPEIIAVILLVFFALICISSVLNKYTTTDESLYIASGFSYLKTGDFRVNIEHPVFTKMLFGAPVFFLGAEMPGIQENWINSRETNVTANYGFASDFFIENKDFFREIVLSARAMAVLLAVLLGLIIFLWAKEAFGTKAGLLALFLYCFEPNVIAHSRLASLDMPLTLFAFASFYFMWKYFNSEKIHFLCFSAISISLALLTKFSALLFFPLLFLFALTQYKKIFKKGVWEKPKQFFAVYAMVLIALLVTPIILSNLIYSFEPYRENYLGVVPARMMEGYEFMGNWVEGGRHGWFFGEFREYIPEFFLTGLLIKTTIAFLFLLAVSFPLALKKKNSEAMKILLPALIFFIALSFFSRFYIGFRYALPAFPFFFLFIAGAFSPYIKKIISDKRILGIFAVALAWHAVASLSIYPHYLAYFNEFIGGPANAPYYLTDSSLDWGQDFFYFKEFAESIGWEKPRLIYFGWPYPNLLFMEFDWRDQCEPVKGQIAISVTKLTGHTPGMDCHHWLFDYEPRKRIGWSIYYYEIE